MNLSRLAEKLTATYTGSADVEVDDICEPAGPPDGGNGLSYVALVSGAGELELAQKSAAIKIVVTADKAVSTACTDRPVILCKSLKPALVLLLDLFRPARREEPMISDRAEISESAQTGDDVHIAPFATVGPGSRIGSGSCIMGGVRIGRNVTIGKRTLLHPNVVVYDDTVIGSDCIVHSNSVIGSDGFGYYPNENGEHIKIPQRGRVVIGNNVEIGACSSVDRATIGETLIGDGTKIDNQVQVGHNSRLGKNVIMAGSSGVAGSVTLADGVILAGLVGVADHVHLETGVIIGGFSGVHKSLDEPGVYAGPYVMKHQEYKKFLLSGKRLDRLEKKMKGGSKKNER